ncbi:hypothetical protein L1987_54178 [Smallanthus sonchifolius]|uniref:Uncharacterized protein n=1 Tax=Smallanthus sonchifolius TaxID=185202 RepID=A0ACB9E6B5_9ASTR|nr:hypothetical protein L1987_54178 [Smallanthus sonchifolius]
MSSGQISKYLNKSDVNSEGKLYLPKESVVKYIIEHMNDEMKDKLHADKDPIDVSLFNERDGSYTRVGLAHRKTKGYFFTNFRRIVKDNAFQVGTRVWFHPKAFGEELLIYFNFYRHYPAGSSVNNSGAGGTVGGDNTQCS